MECSRCVAKTHLVRVKLLCSSPKHCLSLQSLQRCQRHRVTKPHSPPHAAWTNASAECGKRVSTICSTIRHCTRPWSELRATLTSATNMSGSDGSAQRWAEPETGLQISELSVDKEYVLVVFDAWHNIHLFSGTCSMSDANDAQYDWPCNALRAEKTRHGWPRCQNTSKNVVPK